MGKRGPKKKPAELKVIQGCANGSKPKDTSPKPKKIKGAKPPTWLKGKIARKEWREMTPKLEALGLLTEIDLTLLAMYCREVQNYLELAEWVDKNGWCYPIFFPQTKEERRTGARRRIKYMVQWPQVSQMREAQKRAIQLAARFGMSPSDRVGLNVKDLGKSGVKGWLYKR